MCWQTVMDGPGGALERDKGTKSNEESAKLCRAALSMMLPCALWNMEMICRTIEFWSIGL